MNLVGPRPHPVSNLPLFVLVMRNAPACGEQIPYYALRWMVRPGLTGWAQVRYQYANDLEEEVEKMRHDLYYIKHMSRLARPAHPVRDGQDRRLRAGIRGSARIHAGP